MPPARPNTKAKIEFVKPKPATIQLLDRQLTNADPAVRIVGVNSIPKIQAPAEPLAECIASKLEHENWYARRSGAEASVKAVESKGAAESIIKEVLGQRLTHEDFETRRCAFEGIVGIVNAGSAPEPPPLMPELSAEVAAQEAAARLDHEDPRIREHALEALVRMGEMARPFIVQCMARLTDDDASVRRRAVEMCTELGVVVTDALPQVAGILQHQDGLFRRTATKALMRLADHSGEKVAAAIAKELTQCQNNVTRRAILLLMADLGPLFAPHGKIIALQLENEDSGIRICATKTLLAAGPNVATSSLPVVVKRMQHPNRAVSRAAIDCMRAMALMCPSYAQAVGNSLQEDQAAIKNLVEHKVAVFRILGGAGANAVPFLEELSFGLEDKDWAVRRATIEAFEDLQEHARPAAAMVAKRMLNYGPDTRRAAVECLGRMGMNAGPYAARVEAVMDTEEDEDVLETCRVANLMLQQSGVLQIDWGPLPDMAKRS